MDKILGTGEHRYRVATEGDWGELPQGWLYGSVTDVAVDSQDQLYAFTRGDHPVIVFNRDGKFLRSWGEGVFRRPHGIHIGLDDCVYCTDDGDHTVRKFSLDGKLLLQLGVTGQSTAFLSGSPFNRCTHSALSPTGDIYVSDGYGNARVHKYSPDGKLLLSWGEPGTAPGQFNLVHNICCDADGWVYVADRENHRIQVFGGDGRYETQWNNMHRPCGLCMQERTADPYFYVGELGPGKEFSNRDWPKLGPRVSILNRRGEILAKLGDKLAPDRPSQFTVPHGMAVDSAGSIYVGELLNASLRKLDTAQLREHRTITLQKLVRT
jgi:hypothetical protein